MRIRETTLECREMFDRLTRDKEVVEGLAEKLNISTVRVKSILKCEKNPREQIPPHKKIYNHQMAI